MFKYLVFEQIKTNCWYLKNMSHSFNFFLFWTSFLPFMCWRKLFIYILFQCFNENVWMIFTFSVGIFNVGMANCKTLTDQPLRKSFSSRLSYPSFCVSPSPGRSVQSPWACSNFLQLKAWPLTSTENPWTPHLNHGDSTTLAIHGLTPASRYDVGRSLFALLIHSKERLLFISTIPKCKVSKLPTDQIHDIISCSLKSLWS